MQGLPQAKGVTEVFLNSRADNVPADMAATSIAASKILFIFSNAPFRFKAGDENSGSDQLLQTLNATAEPCGLRRISAFSERSRNHFGIHPPDTLLVQCLYKTSLALPSTRRLAAASGAWLTW
jgi:hypothetical protein